MSHPIQQCMTCGAVEHVTPVSRGFPPDIAKRRLAKRCEAAGHTCDPRYTAGLRFSGPITGQATTDGEK